MNNLYGKHYIERQRSSGYKSTTYAMSEIVDNAVDAKATKIQILLSEKENIIGNRRSVRLDRIFFLDNGSGMTEETLNTCLTFSEGAGRSDKRIGAFGVGLPNSSISVCKRVDVYSKTKNGDWMHVFLDVDDQLSKTEPKYDLATKKHPEYTELEYLLGDFNTVVVWSKLDRIDVSKASTLIDRSEKLLGRIYRYKILEDLTISFTTYSQRENNPSREERKILAYDPLFITEQENYITKLIWESSSNEEPPGRHKVLGHLEEFNSKYYYAKFIEGCETNQSKPLFQKFDDYWDVEYRLELNGKTYRWKIRAAFAFAEIANPGVRSGGATKIGKEFGKKMSGDAHFRSSNIFFLRAGREIDHGSFGLYTITDEKNRFWSIEIHFDSDLDELMGLSNNKQSTQFKHVQGSNLPDYRPSDDLPVGLQKEILYNQMSSAIIRAINGMRKQLTSYARDFKRKEEAAINANEGGQITPMPSVEPTVNEVLSKRKELWEEDVINEVSDFLKERYMTISRDQIKDQVSNYAQGQTKTIVLYAPSQNNKLFEITEIRGKQITLINTNHLYYIKVIEPLKSSQKLKLFAISIEMLVSSIAVEMDRLTIDNPGKYKDPIDNLLLQLSARLHEFINDSDVRITTAEDMDE